MAPEEVASAAGQDPSPSLQSPTQRQETDRMCSIVHAWTLRPSQGPRDSRVTTYKG